MEINIGMSECHKNVDNYYGSNIIVWIPRCAGREAFDGVEPLPECMAMFLFRAFSSSFIFVYIRNALFIDCTVEI